MFCRQICLPGLIALLVAACNELPADPITVENQTQQTLQIWGLDADGELNRFHFELDFTGMNSLGREECEPGLAALRVDGSEFARIGQICQGDPHWVITEDSEGSG